jgi:1-aminocyclopropane-1-carboxylate deaminase/D-cysteine desulfhydrase-like pyridoxal-dependent ACC family enzyme
VLSDAIRRLQALTVLPIPLAPTPVEELVRLAAEFRLKAETADSASRSSRLQAECRLLVKRDDAIPFGFGGNKVRKLRLVAAQAIAEGADTLITTGGIQSNHARATASVAAKMGLGCVLVANGTTPAKPTANALLDRLLGAEVRCVARREDRAPAMEEAARELTAHGRRPYVIPLGASTPLGAAAFALAVAELVDQIPAPDVIICSTSSGGTQAGLIAGCTLLGLNTRVIGVSADDPSASIASAIRGILDGLEALIDAPGAFAGAAIDVDDRFVGEGYGVPTPQSTEAIELCARREALFLDPTYTAKAMAALMARARGGGRAGTARVWHTRGKVGGVA